MFFIASKLLWAIAAPTNFLLLLLALGLVLGFTPWARTGRRLSAFAGLVLLIAGFSPLGAVMMSPLEERFARPSLDMPAPTGIIVLGGAVDEDLTDWRNQVTLTEAAGRMTEAVRLARLYPEARLVFSGGSAHLNEIHITESDVARRLWDELGVPMARMSFESASRNTYENAVFTKTLLQPKPGETWILLTSAFHMPRSMGIFRRLGFPVIAYPADYRTAPWPAAVHADSNASANLRLVDAAAREWIGLAAYWLTGRSEGLFPAP